MYMAWTSLYNVICSFVVRLALSDSSKPPET